MICDEVIFPRQLQICTCINSQLINVKFRVLCFVFITEKVLEDHFLSVCIFYTV